MLSWYFYDRTQCSLLQFLHVQERYLATLGGYSTLKEDDEPSDNYFQATICPLASDKAVVLFRNWMKKYSNGRFPYTGNATMTSVDVEEVFDVYNSHTKVSGCKLLFLLSRIFRLISSSTAPRALEHLKDFVRFASPPRSPRVLLLCGNQGPN